MRHLFLLPLPEGAAIDSPIDGSSPVLEVEAVECLPGRGLRGDRGALREVPQGSRVTFFSWDIFCDLRRELSLFNAPVAGLRRHVVTEGVNLREWVGRTFDVQGVTFEGLGLCEPAPWLDQAVGPGVADWLKGRGGLEARVVSAGWLRRQAPSERLERRRLQASDWPEHEFE